MPAGATGTGIHWQVAQATSLMNIVFQLSTAAGNAHQGEFRPAADRRRHVLMILHRYLDGKWQVRQSSSSTNPMMLTFGSVEDTWVT